MLSISALTVETLIFERTHYRSRPPEKTVSPLKNKTALCGIKIQQLKTDWRRFQSFYSLD